MVTINTADLKSHAQNHESDLLSFLQDLVRISSVNGRDSEKSVAERILQEAYKWDLPAQLATKDNSRPNALVTFGRGEKGFALVAHMDTVAEGKHEDWTFPPFSATINGNLLFGRGAADNKAGIACGLYTLVLMRESGLLDPDKYYVTLAGVVDEESGACSPLGVRYLLDSGLLVAEGAIYTYTSDIVCIGHRGLIRIELTTRGESIHAGVAEWHNRTMGVNAVTGLADLILRFEALKIPVDDVPGFDHLGCTITPGTLISGGDYPSIVPNKASAMMDIRLLPGQDASEVLKEVESIIEKTKNDRLGLEVETEIKVNIPGAAISLNHPLTLIAQDFTEIYTGKRWEARGAGPGNEGYMLIGAGIPTLCGFGPTGGNPHAPDEWVEISSLTRTVAIYAGIITKYLTNK